jgi:hypothetical protein
MVTTRCFQCWWVPWNLCGSQCAVPRSADNELLDQIALLLDRYPMLQGDIVFLSPRALNLCALHATRLLKSDEDHDRCASTPYVLWNDFEASHV